MALAQNVIAYTILADGIPIIYQGQEQHYNAEGGSSDPYNREALWLSGYDTSATLYQLIAKLNALRAHAAYADSTYLTYQSYPIYTDTTTIALRKGSVVSVLSNKGADGSNYTQSIASGYSASTALTELLTCDTLTADSSGNIDVPMGAGQARIYYPTSDLSGSGLCGASSKVKRTFVA
jgi:alpha-amylase